MKILGIIAEYNPMHTGHIYHINEAKKITHSDYVVAIMSGSFTEQGNIALIDKFTRAKLAIKNGIDLVIELPSIFAVSDAGNFASKAIQILNGLNIIDCICFGAENDNILLFNKITDILIKKDKQIWEDIREELKKGNSFAKARNSVLANYLDKEEIKLINSPNNILALEYLKKLKLTNSSIVPYAILRNNDFNDDKLNGNYTSSTSIRNALEKNINMKILKKYLTQDIYNYIQTSRLLFNKDLFEILKYKIISMNIDEIKNINGVNEGIENKIKKEIIDVYSYENYIFKLKSKRYELSKIKRILINILLNITKNDFDKLKSEDANYAHILAFNHNKKELLSNLANNSKIPVLTSLNKKNISILNSKQRKLLDFDIYSSNIYSSLNKTKINRDYTNML